MSESTVISLEEAEAIKVADKIISELHEIEEKVYALKSIEAAQFLVDTLERVIIELGGESLLEG